MAAPKNPAAAAEAAQRESDRREDDRDNVGLADYYDRDAPRPDYRGGEDRAFSQRDWEQANAPTDPDRRRQFREKWASTHLPNLPKKAGWHRCWVSTNHPTDTPERRLAVGYRYVQPEDLKAQGWVPQQVRPGKDGAQVADNDTVRWREMIAMECPEELYQQYMREFHNDMPRDSVRDIYAPLNELGERVAEQGGRLDLGDGIREAMKYRRPNKQFE